ncbi:hypothetical protein ACYZTM_01625 [Pseudomonas sp. MDT2-39-1]|jgi:hypothetical protein
MLGQMSASETIAISARYKEAAVAVNEKQDPAPFMDRLLRILVNAKEGGRLQDPQRLYQILDLILHADKAAPHIASTSEPISLALELSAMDPRRQRGKLLEFAMGL